MNGDPSFTVSSPKVQFPANDEGDGAPFVTMHLSRCMSSVLSRLYISTMFKMTVSLWSFTMMASARSCGHANRSCGKIAQSLFIIWHIVSSNFVYSVVCTSDMHIMSRNERPLQDVCHDHNPLLAHKARRSN